MRGLGRSPKPRRTLQKFHPMPSYLPKSAEFAPWNVGAEPGAASEDACLALMDELFPSQSGHAPLGRGDDCAELACPPDMALSTDYFWEGTHFRTAYFTPEEAGAKALAVAVSDLAAAGAVPLGFSLGLMLPPSLERASLRRLLAGMADRAREYGLILSGGDLSRGTELGFCITVWGGPALPGAPFLRRGGAEPGDVIFLIGECGLARAGLWALEREGRRALEGWPAACVAHLRPRPLLAEGRALAAAAAGYFAAMVPGREHPGKAHPGKAHAGAAASGAARSETRLCLMDVSDGPARDLPRLLAGRGADLDFDAGIIPAEAIRAAGGMGREPLELFWEGGEDYALLGTCAEAFWPEVCRAAPGARRLGRVAASPGMRIRGVTPAARGFDHFTAPGGEDKDGLAAEAAQGLPLPPEAHAAARSVVEACRLAGAHGLNAGRHGNISCRVPLRGGVETAGFHTGAALPEAVPPAWGCLITRTGTMKNMAGAGDLALLSPRGEVLAGSAPSSETPLHLAVYARCPGTGAVVHVHPPHLLALGLRLPPKQRLRLPLSEAAAVAPRLAFVPHMPPGSRALAEVVAEAAASHPAVWMEGHGLVVHGGSLNEALALMEELEHLARIHLLSL